MNRRGDFPLPTGLIMGLSVCFFYEAYRNYVSSSMLRIPFVFFMIGFSWLSAQEIDLKSSSESAFFTCAADQTEMMKAQGWFSLNTHEMAIQEIGSLDFAPSQVSQPMPELDSIREKTMYAWVSHRMMLPVASVRGDQIQRDLQAVSAAYRKAGQYEKQCVPAALSVSHRVKKNPKQVLEIIDPELRANPSCACEIVKSAILATDMEVETVVAIVRVAIEANPETMRLVAQCAIAACPDALSAIQELLAAYEKKSGYGKSAKSSKSAKGSDGQDGEDGQDDALSPEELAELMNPLNFPSGPEGINVVNINPPILIVSPPSTTTVNP
jgi:hypothetical protein